MPSPNNSAQLAALAHAARAPKLAGIALAMAGVLLALARWRWWPAVPRALPVACIALALGLIAIGHVRALRFWLARRH